MATGFMRVLPAVVVEKWRHCIVAGLLCLPAMQTLAASVAVAGVSPGKALLVVDGGAPTFVAVGQTTADGVRVIGIEGDSVTIELDGKRRVMRMGQNVVSQGAGAGQPQEVRLAADARGHFLVQGTVNGKSVRFLVDTGATMVSLGAADAARMGIDWRKGVPGVTQTANGQARAWKIRFDSVRVGDITLHGVDGLVHEGDMPVALLGMSFLSRTEMRNEGSTMVLKKRY